MNKPNVQVLVGVTDHLDSELRAMLLAKYSRSYGSIATRIPDTPEKAVKDKQQLRQIYVGYGHKSVGQLGQTTIFFEGVSMLAAMAIEADVLFNGQESSTRYINFDTQPTIDCGNPAVAAWQQRWRVLYHQALNHLMTQLQQDYPIEPGAEAGRYNNAIRARAFDIAGGLLPAGFTTCVGFTGTFDALNDHISTMMFHPLQEVRGLAVMAAEGLMRKYPCAAYPIDKYERYGRHRVPNGEFLSGLHVEGYYYYPGTFEYEQLYSANPTFRYEQLLGICETADVAKNLANRHYPIVDDPQHPGRKTHMLLTHHIWRMDPKNSPGVWGDQLWLSTIERLRHYGYDSRGKYQNFQPHLSNALRFRMSSQMDFRSYRDIHRHRNGFRPQPLLQMRGGLHAYYTDNLPQHLADKAKEMFEEQAAEFKIALANCQTEHAYMSHMLEQQYATPMGAEVPYYFECDLNQIVYMQERRTDTDSHQTARIEMMAAYDQLQQILPGLKVHVDLKSNNFSLKRGDQTFKEL